MASHIYHDLGLQWVDSARPLKFHLIKWNLWKIMLIHTVFGYSIRADISNGMKIEK